MNSDKCRHDQCQTHEECTTCIDSVFASKCPCTCTMQQRLALNLGKVPPVQLLLGQALKQSVVLQLASLAAHGASARECPEPLLHVESLVAYMGQPCYHTA